jgi:hypothetical protein
MQAEREHIISSPSVPTVREQDEIAQLLDALRETAYRASYKGQMYDIRAQVTRIRLRYQVVGSSAVRQRPFTEV